MALDEQAALRSASWGIGQIMGFNVKEANFADVNTMITAMAESEDHQLLAVANFLKHNRLDAALRGRDWRAFARGYNGPNFEENNYDKKLAAAFAQYSILLPDLNVRTAQVLLTYLGFHPGTIDGVMGRMTRAALVEFQQRESLPQTGNADLATLDKLRTKVA
jgi:N-acetylmuramidase/Putative peptidoglycan binding domain